MNPLGQPTPKIEPTPPAEKGSSSPLNFTPEQARREANKLHQLRDDLKTRRSVQDTGIRSSPLGRDD